ERYQQLPTKTHQLIETEPRQSAAYPDIKQQEHHDLAQEIKDAEPVQLMYERSVPTAEKQRRRQHRNGKHVHVFSEKEEGKLHRTVFGMKAGHQLCFRLRQVEGHAVRLRESRHHVYKKSEWLHPEKVPAGNAQVTRLLLNDALKIQSSRLQDH